MPKAEILRESLENKMANQNAQQDDNRFPGLIAHQGTAGTAETIRVVATSAGALTVDLAGTEPIELIAGTVTRVSNIGTLESGSVTVTSMPSGGTISTTEIPLSGVVLTTAVAVGTTAVALPSSVLASRKSMMLYNDGTATIYLGGTGVTSSGAGRGLPVGTSDYSPSFDLGTTTLSGIGATVGGTAIVLEVS